MNAEEGVQEDSISRLSKYTTFNKQTSETRPSITVQTILAHLPEDVDIDPDQYSYANVELSLAMQRNEVQRRNLDPAARRKAERKEAARKKKAEKAERLGIGVLSQESPMNVVSSSPGSERVGMTQPEIGAFGMRPVKTLKRKEKKQRRAGF